MPTLTPVSDEVVRYAVRALLFAPDGRLLLLNADLPEGGTLWCPPGGAIELGESPEEAVLREVIEETGLRLPHPGRHVWTRRLVMTGSDAEVLGAHHHERFFAIQLDELPGIALDQNPDLEELHTLRGFRWWAVDELAAATAKFVPRDLAARVRTLLEGDWPTEPLDLPARL